MSELNTNPYKGTRDFYPEDMYIRNFVFSGWQRVMARHGYEAYDAPLLEPLEVYAAKSGEELVNEQTYQFTDRGGRKVAIRPEMTPSISRMVAAHRQEMPMPARLYSIAQFMRYERPQRGREREFWQLNADIFGDDSMMAEVEILTLAGRIFKEFGATSDMYEIRINHRGLIDVIMREYLGLDEGKAYQMVKLFDRKNKLTDDAFREQLREIAGSDADEIQHKVAQIFAAETLDQLPEELKKGEHYASLELILSAYAAVGGESFRFDPTLMRGLDYYTGMVFEVFDLHPDNNRALFGGGRYDGLVGLFGAAPLSAVGFAPGYSMMELFLSVHGLLPKVHAEADIYLIVMNGYEVAGFNAADQMRDSPMRLHVEVDTTGRKIDKSIRVAEKKGIRFVIVYGESEMASGECQLKDLLTGEMHATKVGPELMYLITQLTK